MITGVYGGDHSMGGDTHSSIPACSAFHSDWCWEIRDWLEAVGPNDHLTMKKKYGLEFERKS